jgi:hypothetical protein
MTNENEQAARYNSNKVSLSFTLPLLTKLESLVSMFGAKKYAAWNHLLGGKATTPIDCMMRHLDALRDGEWLDPDSKLPHAAHIRWNAGQIMQWYYTDKLEWDLPKSEYNDQLKTDLEEAMKNLAETEAKYKEAREKAGLK